MSDEHKQDDTTIDEAVVETAEEQAELNDAVDADDQLSKALEEITQLKEQQLRVQAEMQNVRRRAEMDVEKAHKFGLEKFASEMLTVVDNLERALAAAGDDEATQALREGVEMTLTGLLASLEKFQVQAVDPQGQPFDPELHQAMSMVDNPDVAANTVIAVMQKGYTISGRLLRPAMVMVSKGAGKVDEKA
ncbi:nucleotide exchange factor GrpE [Bacterioplanes sanyensis]|uniref:Protein GrpE n=1 Tax=Bacterioplanes sanyensis TaxID=1249553 RepID=A0A222FFC0_9GAMM|nr:nucleotide exchange factor GrpE [Bacterioplanes sanyensis]ASP37266.1 nucleotide exchange factor GrpE [Bacterioplanes sanyensis]